MKIGITFDLKSAVPAGANVPDDADEEFGAIAAAAALVVLPDGLGERHSIEAEHGGCEGEQVLGQLLQGDGVIAAEG